MPHVFNYDMNKFEQVHHLKVDQRNSKMIHKRSRNGEYCKLLKELEAEAEAKAALRAKRKAAMGK